MSATTLSNQPVLHQMVDDALNQSPYFARHVFRLEAQEGHVVLRGTVCPTTTSNKRKRFCRVMTVSADRESQREVD